MVHFNRALTFAIGAGLDAALGDPPNRWHPVAWLGNAVEAIERRIDRATNGDREKRRWYGASIAAALPLATAAGTAILPALLARRGAPRVLAEAALFSSTLSLRTLLMRAAEVQAALERGDLETARALTARYLVSRDTSGLTEEEVAAAAIESVAENLSDAVVAPCLAYALGGLPAAAAYRAVNTLDAMWGYRDPRYETLGEGSARLDDLVNLLPARLSALALYTAASLEGDEHGSADARANATWLTWRRDAGRTDSPNAGHPMAAIAGALGVRLGKHSQYTLGEEFAAPAPSDIGRSIRLARRAALLVSGGVSAWLAVRGLTK